MFRASAFSTEELVVVLEFASNHRTARTEDALCGGIRVGILLTYLLMTTELQKELCCQGNLDDELVGLRCPLH